MPHIDRIAGAQYALMTRQQLIDNGVSPHTVKRWSAKGRLQLVHPGVYRMVGAPVTWEQRVLAAVLAGGAGAVASHLTAARLWGLADAGADTDAVELTVPDTRSVRLAGVRVHRSADIGRRWVSRRAGIPVTNPLRVMIDAGSVVPGVLLGDMMERALAGRLVTVAGLEAAYGSLGRGRDGAAALRQALDDRALGRARPDGLLEPRMAALLRDRHLPPAVFQHEVRTEAGRFVARIDFAYPESALAIEVDGHEAHATPQALQRDLDRQNALVALGWTVLRFTWFDVVRRPEKVAGDILGVLESAPLPTQ